MKKILTTFILMFIVIHLGEVQSIGSSFNATSYVRYCGMSSPSVFVIGLSTSNSETNVYVPLLAKSITVNKTVLNIVEVTTEHIVLAKQ